MRVRVLAGSLTLATLAAASPALAQSSDTTAARGQYTAEQATRGEQVFRRICSECHETLEYTVPEFRSKWNGRPAFELFDLIRSTMPEESPGSLSAEQYADVLAYIMKLNTAPAGAKALPTADAELKKVKLELPGR